MTLFRNKTLVLAALLLLGSTLAFSQTEDASKILAQASGGVLALVIYGADKAEIANSKGSALAITEDVAATAYHVVSRAFDIEALTAKGKKIKVEGIIAIDKAHDIALLKLKSKVTPLSLTTSNPETLPAGTRVFALGTNESGQITVSEGTLRRFLDIGPRLKVMDMSLAVADPYSGGPIIDVGGQVIGMMLVLDTGVKVGLPVPVLQAVGRAGKIVDFKSFTREDYLTTAEGATFVGQVAAALEETSAARKYLEKAVNLNPSFLDGFSLLAHVYDAQRDYPAAADAYRRVTELDGTRADAFYGLGSVLMRMTKYADAAAAFEKAISLNINNKEIYFELGGVYEALQNWAKAAEVYEKYIALKPEVTWNAYLRLGFCRMSLNQFDAAIAAYQEALKAQPKDLKLNMSLAEAYEKAGQFEKAEETYGTLAQINPTDARTYYGQAYRMYDAAGKFDKAIGPAKKIMELEPKNEGGIYNLGLIYFKLQKYDEAIDAFKQVVAVKPEMSNAWFQIGSCYFQQKKYKDAIEAYKKFTSLAPDEVGGWLSLGVSYMYDKNFEGALEPMKKAVEIKPDNASAQFNLAIVYINLKDMFSAKEIYKKLTTLDPALAERLKKHIR